MKKNINILFFALTLSFTLSEARAQCPHYTHLLQEGDAKFKASDYRGAINKYQAAITDCPERAGEVQPRVLNVFEKIGNLLERSEFATAEAAKARIEMGIALARNEKLINSLFFYEDRLALASDGRHFGYVNKGGDTLIPYQFDKASLFYDPGFAIVGIDTITFLVGTNGEKWRYADGLTSLDNTIRAVKISSMSNPQHVSKLRKANNNLKCLIIDTVTPLLKYRYLLPMGATFATSLLSEPADSVAIFEPFFEEGFYSGTTAVAYPDPILLPDSLEILKIGGGLFGSLSFSASNCENIRRLSLINRAIESCPRGISELQSLEYLDLSGNDLQTISIPFTSLVNVSRINLRDNALSFLPVGLKNMQQLVELDISNNEFSTFPMEILQIKSLKKLLIGRNPFLVSVQEREVIIDKLQSLLPNCKVYFD